MAYLVDTNILLRSTQPQHPLYAEAVQAVTTLLGRGEDVCFVPQNIREFWNVCTRPVAHNGLGLTPAQASAEVKRIETLLTLVPDHPAVYPEWRQLVVTHAVLGVQVHDAYLVAVMSIHRITHILTYNTDDFARYTNIATVHPQAV